MSNEKKEGRNGEREGRKEGKREPDQTLFSVAFLPQCPFVFQHENKRVPLSGSLANELRGKKKKGGWIHR